MRSDLSDRLDSKVPEPELGVVAADADRTGCRESIAAYASVRPGEKLTAVNVERNRDATVGVRGDDREHVLPTPAHRQVSGRAPNRVIRSSVRRTAGPLLLDEYHAVATVDGERIQRVLAPVVKEDVDPVPAARGRPVGRDEPLRYQVEGDGEIAEVSASGHDPERGRARPVRRPRIRGRGVRHAGPSSAVLCEQRPTWDKPRARMNRPRVARIEIRKVVGNQPDAVCEPRREQGSSEPWGPCPRTR